MSTEKDSFKWMKLRLLPNKKQEKLMWKHVNHSRAIKNIFIARCFELLDNKQPLNKYQLTKELTVLRNKEGNEWMKEVSRKTLTTAIDDVYVSFIRYFKKVSGRPKFKSRKKATPSFGVRSDDGKFFRRVSQNKLKIEKIGEVKIAFNSLKNNLTILERVEEVDRLRQSSIVFDGKFWYIMITYKSNLVQDLHKELSDEVIGVDLGVRTLATLSNEKTYKNINRSDTMKKLEKKLSRKNRQLSRMYEMNKQGSKYVETKNAAKVKKEVKLLHRKIKNIRDNHTNNMTKEIVNEYPQEIIIEDLKPSRLAKNKHLAKHILGAKFYDIRKQLEYKSKERGILITVADMWYPSSQICSSCGNTRKAKEKLLLKDTIYKCKCGYKVNRDLNAALNLKNYRYSDFLNQKSI